MEKIQLSRKQIIIGVIGLVVLIALIVVITGLFIKSRKNDDMYKALLEEKDKRIEESKEHEAYILKQAEESKQMAEEAIATAAEDRKLFLANQKNYLSINSRYEKIPQRVTDIVNLGDDAIRQAFRDY